MGGAGRGGYGAALGIKEEGRPEAAPPRQSASSELAQPDTQHRATAKDAPSTDSPPMQYRVLFVLRVVPPTMLAAPAADTAAESLPADDAASPAAEAAAAAPAEPPVPVEPPAQAVMQPAPAAAPPSEAAEPAPE